MSNTLHIGLDLGGDALKIAFSFFNGSKNIYGKITTKSRLTKIGVSAVAYFNQSEKKWYFGDEIPNSNESFSTVVKIKNLINLLTPKTDNNITKSNINYYHNGHDFPLFFFPESRTQLDNFDNNVKEKKTFKDNNHTPEQVCCMFFEYVKRLIDEQAINLKKEKSIEFDNYKISLSYPSKTGDEYLEELNRIIENVFGQKPFKELTSNKALSMYASFRGQVKNNESFLVFDMGADSMSVVRAIYISDTISVDGAEGHNAPISIGGIDIDNDIVSLLNNKVLNREMVGSESAGSEGHVFENSVYGKQYVLMKDIRKAKILLSKPQKENSMFANGVPITLSRDLLIQTNLSKLDILNAIGITTKSGTAEEIAKYISSECKRSINKDIKKIFLAGGLIETYGLQDYIEQRLQEEGVKVSIETFDDFNNSNNQFEIQSYEDSAYASSIGASLVSLFNKDIRLIFTFSYGSWYGQNGEKRLSLFVERGTFIEPGKFYYAAFGLRNYGTKGEEILSTNCTNDQINYLGSTGKPNFINENGRYVAVLGDIGSNVRKQQENLIGIKTVSGGPNSTIRMKYNGRFIRILGDVSVSFAEGIVMDKNGIATPDYRNNVPSNSTAIVRFEYLTNKLESTGSEGSCYAKNVEFVANGMQKFTGSSAE